MSLNIGKWFQKLIDLIRGKHKRDDDPIPQPEIPDVEGSSFSYEPHADHIILTVPARIKPTKLSMFTNNGHVDLGTEGCTLSRNEQGDYIYTLPRGGAEWAARATEASPRHYPSLQPFWKTAELQLDWVGPDGIAYNNYTVKIIDPTLPYGDEARIAPGLDH